MPTREISRGRPVNTVDDRTFLLESTKYARSKTSSAIGSGNVYEDLALANLAVPDFGTFAFPAAGTVFQPDVPAMPAAKDFSGLHQTFAERESKVGAAVFDGINTVVPAK
jgi:hypothetical protein